MGDEDRRRRLLILLDSYLDYLPRQFRSSIETTSGPAPSRRSRCDFCQGTGQLGRSLCPICDGHGRRTRRKGEPFTDDYTGEIVGSAQAPEILRAMSGWQLDAELARLDRACAEREGKDSGEFAWLRKKDALRRNGDYQALERALLWMRLRKPLHFSFLWKHHVLHMEIPNQDAPRILKEGLAILDNRMPEQIRVPSWLLPDDIAYAQKASLKWGRTPGHEKQRGERNQRIREQFANGRSTSWLAVEFNLARRTIQHILATECAKNPGNPGAEAHWTPH